jgi:tripartite-type tricarboxylate transporter receptor subunit TctC
MRRRQLLASLAALPGAASAQTPGQGRTISFVIPLPPGGPTDRAPRIAMEFLSPLLGTPIVALNRPGAGGAVAAEYVARSRPDGLTVFATSNATLSIRTVMERISPYRLEDFTSAGSIAADVGVIAVRKDSPFRSLADVVAASRREPGRLSYASAGPGSVSHLSMELFKLASGADILHVPYAGSGPARTAILAGDTQLVSAAYSAVATLFSSGELIALATTAASRIADLPDVPTLEELGFRGATLNIWMGLFLPVATPPEIVARMSEALATAARDPAMSAALRRALLVPDYRDGQATMRLLHDEQEAVRRVAAAVQPTN